MPKPKGTLDYFPRSMPKDERLQLVSPLLIKLYNEEGKLSSQSIDRCNYLPSYHTTRSLIDEPGKAIEPLYQYLSLEIPKNQKKHLNPKNYSLEMVKQIFADCGCVLLEKTYKDANTKMEYICHCGSKGFVDLHNFQRTVRCRKCYVETNRGENHHSWVGDKRTELARLRSSNAYIEWRNNVYARDNYTCQCCGNNKGGNLQAHHILNFASNEKLRFELNNGVTLCESCHNPSVQGSFHYVYGTRNNTREQLEEYIKNRKEMILNVS